MSALRRLPADPRLPQLGVLFDTDEIARRVCGPGGPQVGPLAARAAAIETASIAACEIERVKYRPGRSCVVGYRLRIRHGTRAARWQRLTLAMYPRGEGRRRFERARAESGADAETAPAVRWLASLDAIAWRFPRDRKLPSLPALADSGVVRGRWLPALAACQWGECWRVVDARMQIVSYFPEHACTIRVKARLARREPALRRVWTLYGKARYDDAGERSFELMRLLERDARLATDAVAFARALGYEPHERILWQEAVRAPTLDRLLSVARGRRDRGLWPRVARGAAALHRSALDLPVRLGHEALGLELARASEVVAQAAPEQMPALRQLLRELAAGGADLDREARATLHGDLHSRNILIDAERVTLIDLDRVARGLPHAELGSLLAEHVYRTALARQPFDRAALEPLIEAYRAEVPWPVDASEVRWHLAAALIRERCYRCVTSLKPGRFELLPRLIEDARLVLRGTA